MSIGEGALFFQSIIPPEVLKNEEVLKNYYDNEYVRSQCLSWSAGRSFVFQARGQTVQPYPIKASSDWLTSMHTSGHVLFHTLAILNGKWLDAMFTDIPSVENLTKEQVQYIRAKSDAFRKLHAAMMKVVQHNLTLMLES